MGGHLTKAVADARNRSDQNNVDEPDSDDSVDFGRPLNDHLWPTEAPLEVRIDHCFQGSLKCLVYGPGPGMDHCLRITNEDLLVLVHRPQIRHDFLAAIETRLASNLERFQLELKYIGPERAYRFDFPAGARKICLEEIGRALSLCHKLRSAELSMAYDSEADELCASLLALLPRLEKVSLWDSGRPSGSTPVTLFQSICRLPNLRNVHLRSVNRRTLCRCLRCLASVSTLKALTLGDLYPTVSRVKIVIGDTEANLLSQLLRLNQLESLRLQHMRISSMSAWRSICASLVLRLTEIGISNVEMDEGSVHLFDHFGSCLGDLKWIENVHLRAGAGESSENMDESCQLTILRAAASLPRLQGLSLPKCVWTPNLATALNDLARACPSLRQLDIQGSVHHSQPNALLALTSAIRQCRLERLSCWLSSEESLRAIAAEVRDNTTIKELTLWSDTDFSFDEMSRICFDLRLHPMLQTLNLTRSWFPMRPRDVSPEALERLVSALSVNVVLESVCLAPYIYDCKDLDNVIQIFTRMNKQGRRYIKNLDDPEFREKAVCFLEAINDSSDCLYAHLHDIPTMFRR